MFFANLPSKYPSQFGKYSWPAELVHYLTVSTSRVKHEHDSLQQRYSASAHRPGTRNEWSFSSPNCLCYSHWSLCRAKWWLQPQLSLSVSIFSSQSVQSPVQVAVLASSWRRWGSRVSPCQRQECSRLLRLPYSQQLVRIGVGAADRSVQTTVPTFDGVVRSRGGCMDVPHTWWKITIQPCVLVVVE